MERILQRNRRGADTTSEVSVSSPVAVAIKINAEDGGVLR